MESNRIGRVLRSEGMKPRAMSYFYKRLYKIYYCMAWKHGWFRMLTFTFGSLGVFTQELVGTSLGATSGFWRMDHGIVCRRWMYLKTQVCRQLRNILEGGGRQYGVSQGIDLFMRLVDNRRLWRPTSTKQFGGS